MACWWGSRKIKNLWSARMGPQILQESSREEKSMMTNRCMEASPRKDSFNLALRLASQWVGRGFQFKPMARLCSRNKISLKIKISVQINSLPKAATQQLKARTRSKTLSPQRYRGRMEATPRIFTIKVLDLQPAGRWIKPGEASKSADEPDYFRAKEELDSFQDGSQAESKQELI